MGRRLVLPDGFSRPHSLFFGALHLGRQCLYRFVVMAERRKFELAIEPDVLGCRTGVFAPQAMAVFARWIVQNPLLLLHSREWGDSM